MRTHRRILVAALALLLGAPAAQAGTDYYAVLVRSLDPLESVLLEKVKINDKKKLRRMAQEGPLTKKQYQKLPKISFAEVQSLRIEGGRLRLRTESGDEGPALPDNFKRWPKGGLDPADVVHGSTLKGRDAGSKRKFSAVLADGWIVYLFPQRPSPDTLAFALAEAQGSEEAWVDFLQRFPASPHASAPRDRLATLYAERAREHLGWFEQAVEQKQPGYAGLGEARLWLQRARALNLVTDELQETNTAVAQREAEVRARLAQARTLLQEARFPEAEEQLAPLLHFRGELPELATLYEDLLTQASAHHLKQARERLSRQQFDQAVQEVEQATRYRARPEIERLREEITVARAAYQQQQQILAALEAARAAAERGNVARAFETLYPLARQHPEESTLQQEFASIQSSYRQHLLAQAPQVERLHVPIKGPADEEALLKTQRALARLSQVESSTELAVWRDGLGAHLAAYYRQRARTLAGRAGAAFPALSYAYLQQARGFVLDQAGLAELEPYRHRLEEALRIRLALDFRDVTPGAGGEYLIAELRALSASAVQEAGFPHLDVIEARRNGDSDATLALIGELMEAAVRDDSTSEAVPSSYSAGVHQAPNPAWREAKRSYDQALERLAAVREQVEANRRRKKYSKQQRASDNQALQKAEGAVREAGQALEAVPGFVEQEDVVSYEFIRRHWTRTAKMRFSYRWVNARTGIQEGGDILTEEISESGEESSGVHPADKQGRRNQPVDLTESAALRGRALRTIQQKLAARALEHLEAFVARDLERARLEVQGGNDEQAAEYYLRFLFNSGPDHKERPEAVAYLQNEFHFVTLGDWLPGVEGPAASN